MKTIWNRTNGWRLPAIALAIAVFAIVNVLTREAPPAKTPIVTPPTTSYKKQVAGIGVIEPKSELIGVGTEIAGVVRTINVKPGDIVDEGQLLFGLDERDVDAQLRVLKASLESAKIQAEDFETQYKMVLMVSDDRAVSRDEVNRKRFAAELGRSRVNEIRSQLELAQTTKKRLSVRAPIQGSILDVNIRPGEFVANGNTGEPAIRMGDVSTLHLRVEFDEENAVAISPDSPARAMKRGDPGVSYALEFVRVEPFVTTKQNLAVAGQRVDTRVLQVIYALPPEAQSLLSGQQMDVFVNIEGNGA